MPRQALTHCAPRRPTPRVCPPVDLQALNLDLGYQTPRKSPQKPLAKPAATPASAKGKRRRGLADDIMARATASFSCSRNHREVEIPHARRG